MLLSKFVIYIVLCVILKVWLATAIAAAYWLVSTFLFRCVLGLKPMEAWGALALYHDPGNSLLISSFIIAEQFTYDDCLRYFEKFVAQPGTDTMRSVFVRVLGNGYWVPDRNYATAHHIVHYNKKPIHTRAELISATAEEMMVPLPPHCAQWQVLVIPDFDPVNHLSALIWKVCHSLGDGISFSVMFWRCSTVAPNLYKTLPRYSLCQRMLPYILFPFLIIYSLCTTFSSEDTNAITYHNGKPLSGIRVAASAGPYSIPEIHERCRQQGITINDMACAAMLRAMRKYLETYSDPPQRLPDDATIHADIPFTYRHRDSKITLSIKIALFSMSLPLVKGENPREDLRLVSSVTQRVKGKKCMLFGNIAMAMLESYIPPDLLYTLALVWSKGSSLVFTNVPGTKNALEFEGKKAYDMHFLSPATGYNPTAVGITSYNEQLSMLLVSDRNRLEHPDKYAEYFDEALKLYLAA